jgi:hypothetical protein
MQTQIPPDAKTDAFSITRDLDFAAACLADDRVPRLPPEDVKAFVEDAQRIYVFKFEQSERYSEMAKLWTQCKTKGIAAAGEDMIGYIFDAFRYADRLSALIRSGAGSHRPEDNNGNFWTTNTKAAAAALSIAKCSYLSDERLIRMILWDGDKAGYFMRDDTYFRAFLEPEEYCAKNPESPLSAIVAGFFHRERLRDVVNGMPARHVFREIGESGLPKISFIAEPVTAVKM